MFDAIQIPDVDDLRNLRRSSYVIELEWKKKIDSCIIQVFMVKIKEDELYKIIKKNIDTLYFLIKFEILLF